MAFFDVSLEDLLKAQVEVEQAKFGARLQSTQEQPGDFAVAPRTQNVQAKAQSTQSATKASNTKNLLIGGGIAAAVVVLIVAFK